MGCNPKIDLSSLIDWLIHYSALKAMKHLIEIRDRDTTPILLRLIPGDILSACLHRQVHTLYTRSTVSNSHPNACVQCRFFWLLIWPGHDANPQLTVWKADTLTTKPSRHGISVGPTGQRDEVHIGQVLAGSQLGICRTSDTSSPFPGPTRFTGTLSWSVPGQALWNCYNMQQI